MLGESKTQGPKSVAAKYLAIDKGSLLHVSKFSKLANYIIFRKIMF